MVASKRLTRSPAGESESKVSGSESKSRRKATTSGNDSESYKEDEEEDQLASSSEMSSESSGLEDLETKDPSAVEAKFAEEAARWVDGELDAPDDDELDIADAVPTYLSSVCKSPTVSPTSHSPIHSPLPMFSPLPSCIPSPARSPEHSPACSSVPSKAQAHVQQSPGSSPARSPAQSAYRTPPTRSRSSMVHAGKRERKRFDSSDEDDTSRLSPVPPPKKKTCKQHDGKDNRDSKSDDHTHGRVEQKNRSRAAELTARNREQEKHRREKDREQKDRERKELERKELEQKELKRRERERKNGREVQRDGEHRRGGREQDKDRRGDHAKWAGRDVESNRKDGQPWDKVEKDRCRTDHPGPLSDDDPPRKPGQKRKRQDENISWVSESRDQHSKTSRSRKRRDIDDAASDLASDYDDDGDDDERIDLCSHGPRPNLGDQYPRVYRVAVRAIKEVETLIGTVNAFPEGEADGHDYLQSILIKHATALKYKEMTKKLQDERNKKYWTKFASIPAQRVSLLRGKVKKLCEGVVCGAYGLVVGDSAKVTWLLEGIAYTFPHDYNTRTIVRNKPYSPQVFEDMLQVAFFSKRTSYGYRISHLFTSSLPDQPSEKEIPAAMLALISTAIYAAIDDFKYNRYETQKFEANVFIQAYRKNMQNLSEIKRKNIAAYHRLMHDLYLRVTGASGGSSDAIDTMDYLDAEGMI